MKANTHWHVVLALIASTFWGQQALAQMPPATGTAPHYFSVANYANSQLPTVNGTLVTVGNPLISRQFASGSAVAPGTLAPNLVVVPTPLPVGVLQSFETFNQTATVSGPLSQGNVFHAYVLRPTGVAGQYLVVFDSGLLAVPVPVDPLGEIAVFPVPNVAVQAGDLLAFYGQGIPLDLTGGDTLSAPALIAPVQGGTVTLG